MMQKIILLLSVFCLLTIFHQEARADLDNVLFDLTNFAKADIYGYETSLSDHFNIPRTQVQRTIRKIGSPADAFMCLLLSLWTGRDVDNVINVYRTNKGKGWGVIAKDLGIKPGSAQFHALKEGNFFYPMGKGGKPGLKTFHQKAGAGLDNVLFDLMNLAKADLYGYETSLSAHFNIPRAQVQRTIRKIDSPADAFMCLLLSLWTGRDVDSVINVYKTNKGKGWGVIAKDLGIKPGSAQFHALKEGNFFYPKGKGGKPGNGKGKGKKKKNKGNGNGKKY